MKNETPRTTALIADIVQNPGLEWTRAEVEELGEHAFQLERELNELTKHVKLSLDNEKYGPCEWEAWNEKAKRLINQ